MIFLREHLLQDHYSWPPDNSASFFTGTPSRRLFDRFNGVQVLFIINSVGNISPAFSIEEGQKAEELLRNKLPLGSQSELSVFNWLKDAL